MKKYLLDLLLQDDNDDDIDFSDIPEVKDFSHYKPFKPHLDKMREHNLRLQAEREKALSK